MATSARVEWAWNASANPFSKTEPPKWRPYSDIDNRMIEQASAAKQDKAMLDEYYIDFSLKRQVSNVDKNRQRPVHRFERDHNDGRGVRKDRFLPNPVELNGSILGQCGFISCFIKEVAKFLKINREQLPSKDPKFIPMILERAATGIIAEGNSITPGRPREAAFIAELLRAKKANSFKEIWEFCANLYTWDSFLYKQINDTMRLVGNPQHEQVWRSKISTIGPYCLLLWDNPFSIEMIKPGTVLYRGTQVADNLIRSFQDECTREPKIWHTLQGFTSCTRNRSTAEQFGNVVFIMKTRTAFTIDLTQLSEYRQEEEELLLPGISFTVNQVETDKSKNKYLIYLSVHQRHIKSNQQQPKRPNTASRPNRPISDRDLDRDNFDRDFDCMNLRDGPIGHDDLLAVLASPTADFDDLSLLIYRYGRDIDWK